MEKDKVKLTKDDFQLVQQDRIIHDLDLETKPTTYFKDAMRRFVKNKSSVAASVIIGILVLLAIVVPIFNKSDIDSAQTSFRFLPPRWRGFENSNILNGREKVEGIVTDMNHPDGPLPVGFQHDAIIGELETYQTTTNTAHPQASGGVVKIASDTGELDLSWSSNKVQFVTFDEDYELEFVTNTELNADYYYEVYGLVEFMAQEEARVVLIDKTNEYGLKTVNITEKFLSVFEDVLGTGYSFANYVRIGVTVFKPDDTMLRQELFIDSLVVKDLSGEDDTPFADHNFVEGNELLLRRTDDSKADYRFNIASGSKGRMVLHEAKIMRSNFVYDYYLEVYGEKRKFVDERVMNRYVELGYIKYEFEESINGKTVTITSFELLDEKRSPVRELHTARKLTSFGVTVIEFEVTVSVYREVGYTDYPYFFFGTNHQGHDYFKVIFSGLRTSLLLGISAAAINILIGLVWGSISGYYGGTVDIVMERFTEILGGIPWIIIMTLAILHLGNSFEVFLLALILTGWIGVAATTRSQFYRYKRREYVLASRTLGAKDSRLIFKHILPNSVGPIVTGAVLMIPGIIFSEATISYLGLGLQGLHSMGVALSEVQEFIYKSPYLIVSGSIVIALLLISFNLFGNGLRDAFNPSLKGSE